jgi:hypothetical protein
MVAFSCYELLTYLMATHKLPPKKGPLLVRSHSLTLPTETTLKRLSQDASDYIGTGVSSSAIIRALIRYVDRQDALWIRESLFPLIEEEMSQGTRWGKTKS